MKAKIKSIVKCILIQMYCLYYRLCCLTKMHENQVLFLDIRFLEQCDSFKLLYNACKNNPELETVSYCLGESVISRGQYWKRCFTMLKHVAQAKIVFIEAGNLVLSSIPLRTETKLVQVWHGCGAFKCFGYDTGLAEDYYGNLSLVTVSAEEMVDVYSNAMHVPKENVKPVGVSRTDVFFDKQFIELAQKRIYEKVPFRGDRKIILYAPTFRGNGARAQMPKSLDIEKMQEHFGREYILIYKGHPAVGERFVVPKQCEDFAIDLTKNASIEDLICAADICISDYSSLILEFALFEKPMIFYAYDYEEYVTERGFYYTYEDFVPGPICRTTEQVVESLKSTDLLAKERIRTFRNRFMNACDGNATDRIMRWVMEHIQ